MSSHDPVTLIPTGYLDAATVLERLCKLQEDVSNVLGHDKPADCFCAKGGYWGASTDYGPTKAEGYRNAGRSLEFIERATRTALQLQKLHPNAQADAIRDLCFALKEWKDAGGHVMAVVGAIQQYVSAEAAFQARASMR